MMPNDELLVPRLNAVLRHALTGINQYFLHARMLKHMGCMKLADAAFKASIDKMKHSDLLVERILALGGAPNLQDLGALRIGRDVRETLACDMALEQAGHASLKPALALCETLGDTATLELLRAFARSESEHTDFVRAQLEAVDSMGEAAYVQGATH